MYNVPKYVQEHLTLHFNEVQIMDKLYNINEPIKDEDKFICMWFDDPTIKFINKYTNSSFPEKQLLTNIFTNRERMTKIVDKHSVFGAERDYVQCYGNTRIMVPRLSNSLQVVVKVGEGHRGSNKYLLYPGQSLTVDDSVIFEEFVENAKSVRVLLIGDKAFIVEYFDDPEHLKSPEKEWIKNINTIIKVREDIKGFEHLVEDTKNISKAIDYDYLAVDYVYNEEKTVCLELNPFPGTTSDLRVHDCVKEYWYDKVKGY